MVVPLTKRLLLRISRPLLRRRRRSWRYVSPHRKRAGLLLLALLVTLAFAYWHLTGEHRVRDQAERFLEKLTGGQVSIRDAKFSLFGGITLQGVTIELGLPRTQGPFFQAKTVTLYHRPWRLLFGGGLVPTELVCIEPNVALPRDWSTLSDLFPWGRDKRSPLALAGLPRIRVQNGRINVVEAETGIPLLVSSDVNVTMVPKGGDSYVVSFEGKQRDRPEPIWGTFAVNLLDMQVRFEEGSVPIQSLDEALPEEYRQWRRRYQVTGRLIPQTAEPVGLGNGSLSFRLVDVGLVLPPREGGVSLTGLSGTMTFDFERETVFIEQVSGTLPAAGDARFTMTGRYGGFQPNSPFEVHVNLQAATVPTEPIEGGLGQLLADLDRDFQPRGKFDLAVDVRRDGEGTVDYEGTLRLEDISIRYSGLPYRLSRVSGQIRLEPGRGELDGLVGHHGTSVVRVDGFLTGLRGGQEYEVQLRVPQGETIALDEDLREALPARFARVWDAIDPAGSATGAVRIDSSGVTVHANLHGDASMSYEGFPYPLENVRGRLIISGDTVRIESLRGSRGEMACRADGTLVGLETDHPRVDLELRAWNVPVDPALLAAIQRVSPAAARMLKPVGRFDHLDARITRRTEDTQLDYRIDVTPAGATFLVEEFPYQVERASGRLTIRPSRMTIHSLQGAHGQTDISLTGLVHRTGKNPAFDLRITADALMLDDDLFDALSPDLRDVWGELGLGGQVGVELLIRTSRPGGDGDAGAGGRLEYLLTADAKGLNLRYEGFPYPLNNLHGRIVASPGLIVLEDLRTRSGEKETILTGKVTHSAAGVDANLSVTARKWDVDETLLQALPKELSPLLKRIGEVGTCTVDLDRFRFSSSAAVATTGPTGPAATRPATEPGRRTAWDLAGSIGFDNVMIDLGFGPKRLSGSLSGKGGKTSEGFSLEAGMELSRVKIGSQEVVDFSGQLRKSPHSRRIVIDELTARAHGGRLAGYAEVSLKDPLEYGVRLDVQDIAIEDLFPDGKASVNGGGNVTGVLDGRLELTTVAGHPERRRGAGQMRLAEANIRQLPVVLGFMHVIYIALPGQSALAEGSFSYRIRGDTLIFDEIHLSGPTLSIVGSGTLDLHTNRLNLDFFAYTGPPGRLPPIAGLDQLVSGIIRELVEVKVTGRISRPQFRTVPLRGLEAAIRRLSTPGQGRD